MESEQVEFLKQGSGVAAERAHLPVATRRPQAGDRTREFAIDAQARSMLLLVRLGTGRPELVKPRATDYLPSADQGAVSILVGMRARITESQARHEGTGRDSKDRHRSSCESRQVLANRDGWSLGRGRVSRTARPLWIEPTVPISKNGIGISHGLSASKHECFENRLQRTGPAGAMSRKGERTRGGCSSAKKRGRSASNRRKSRVYSPESRFWGLTMCSGDCRQNPDSRETPR